MQLKYKETLGRGRGEGGAGVLTSGACDEGGAGQHLGQGRGSGVWRMAASRSGSGAATGAGAASNLGSGQRTGCAESARRPTGDGGGESGELDLGEVAVGKDEPRV